MRSVYCTLLFYILTALTTITTAYRLENEIYNPFNIRSLVDEHDSLLPRDFADEDIYLAPREDLSEHFASRVWKRARRPNAPKFPPGTIDQVNKDEAKKEAVRNKLAEIAAKRAKDRGEQPISQRPEKPNENSESYFRRRAYRV